MTETSVDALRNIATQLRIDSVRSTSEAGSGHPTTCLSAAEIVATLFFREMRYDPKMPQNPDNDRFVLSKGHAAPILYAAWAEAGLFPRGRPVEAAADRQRSRGPPDAAAPVCRRRHRIARSGHLRRDWHRAQRPAHQVGLPHVRAARRRRNGRGLRLGSGQHGAALQARQPLRDHRRQWRSARASRRSSATTWTRLPGAGRPSAGTPSSSTATTCRRCSTRSRPRVQRQAARRWCSPGR